jgi:hypothetical protein
MSSNYHASYCTRESHFICHLRVFISSQMVFGVGEYQALLSTTKCKGRAALIRWRASLASTTACSAS